MHLLSGTDSPLEARRKHRTHGMGNPDPATLQDQQRSAAKITRRIFQREDSSRTLRPQLPRAGICDSSHETRTLFGPNQPSLIPQKLQIHGQFTLRIRPISKPIRRMKKPAIDREAISVTGERG